MTLGFESRRRWTCLAVVAVGIMMLPTTPVLSALENSPNLSSGARENQGLEHHAATPTAPAPPTILSSLGTNSLALSNERRSLDPGLRIEGPVGKPTAGFGGRRPSGVPALPPRGQLPVSSPLSNVTWTRGLDASDCGCLTPNPQVGYGDGYLVELVGDDVALCTPGADCTDSGTLASIFGSGASQLSNPQLLFDPGSSRWMISVLNVTGEIAEFAVSQTSNPSGSWWVYTLPSGTSPAGMEQVRPSISAAQYVIGITGTLVNSTSQAPVEAFEFLVQKSTATSGGPLTSTLNFDSAMIYPLAAGGPADEEEIIFVGSYIDGPSTGLWIDDWNCGPALACSGASGYYEHPALSAPPLAPEAGTSDKLATGTIWVQSTMLADQEFWVAFDTGCTPPGDQTVRACIVVESENPTYGSGENLPRHWLKISASGTYVFDPTVSVDQWNDVVVGFDYSNATTYPSVAVTAHAANDRGNSTDPWVWLQNGTQPVTSGCNSSNVCSWGNDSSAAVEGTGPDSWVASETSSTTSTWSTSLFEVEVRDSPITSYDSASRTSADASQSVIFTVGVHNGTCGQDQPDYCRFFVSPGDGGALIASPCVFDGGNQSELGYAYPNEGNYVTGGFASIYPAHGCTAGTELYNLSLPSISMTIDPPLLISLNASKAPFSLDAGQPITFNLTVELGDPPYTISWPSLPAGCSGGDSLTVNCTPTAAFNGYAIGSATDANQNTVSAHVVVGVYAAPDLQIVASRPTLDVDQNFTLNATASLGSGNYSLRWLSLPPGCGQIPPAANASTLSVPCQAIMSGKFNATARVNDSNNRTVNATSSSIQVTSDPVAILVALSQNVGQGQTVSLRAEISGGLRPYSFNWTDLPAGCHSQDNSNLTCRVTASGVVPIEVVVTDANGWVTPAALNLDVRAPPLSLTTAILLGIGVGAAAGLVIAGVIISLRRRRTPPKVGSTP